MSSGNKFIGIEIGGTKLQLVKADEECNIEQKLRYNVDAAAGANGIRRQVEEGLQQLGAGKNVAAIGIGFGGPVDSKTGMIRISHQVEGWVGFDPVQWLHEKTGKPVAVDNDANTAALAEALHGSGKGYDTVFYMTIGSGIGGGIVIHQEVYHGRVPGEVEVGHLRLNKSGETLEDGCSGWAVNQKVKAAIEQEPGGLLARLQHEQKTGPEAALLLPALESGDATAQQIVADTADDIAFALSHVVHLFHPDILILGGGLSLLNEHLRKPVAERLNAYVMQAFLPPPLVAIASLSENAVPIGAVELAKKIYHRQSLYQPNKSSL